MQNAHLRMGKLTFARQTRDTITNVTVGMNCLVADPPDSREMAKMHLLSVFGGDQDIGAIVAAARERTAAPVHGSVLFQHGHRVDARGPARRNQAGGQGGAQ